MRSITIELTDMANGGAALGRDDEDRVIFVPFGIPGEVVRVDVPETDKRYAWGKLVEIVKASRKRIEPTCPNFGLCSRCHFQHIDYEAQLRYKCEVLADQLNRIGGIDSAVIQPAYANPEPWAYATEIVFNPTPDGHLGFWSRHASEVIPINICPITRPDLVDLYHHIDLELTGLRQLTLRQGADGSMLALFETEGAEPPALETNMPISANLKIFGGKLINLIGDNHLVYLVKDRTFRASATSFFYPSPGACNLLVDTIINYASQENTNTLLELFSGVGMLTSFLADYADEVIAIEKDENAVGDTTVNLANTDNVSLYQGMVEEIMPNIEIRPELVVVDPPASGLPVGVVDMLAEKLPDRLLYVSADSATLARDAKRLLKAGLLLEEIQPIDMYPQAFNTLSVSYWKSRE